MSKKSLIITSIIILVLLFLTMPYLGIKAAAEDDFAVNGDILTKYNGKDTEVVIPSNISSIGPGAFEGSKITSLVIPDTVKVIGDAAFHECKKLEMVTIKSGVSDIGNSAFASCEKLSIINIPDSVNKLGYGVFADDISLKNISLGADSNYFFNDGVLYDKDSTELIQYLSGRENPDFEMPFSVKSINKYAFWGAKNLEYVQVSNNVSVIPAYAFSGCSSLLCVFLPESVKRIDDYAFYNCSNLCNLIAEKSDIKVATSSLKGCDKASFDKGLNEDSVKTIIANIKNNRKANEETENNETDTGNEIKEELSGATGRIHDGKVSIFDHIDKDSEDVFSPLQGEIGSGKTQDGSVNVFIDNNKETIGTITLDKAEQRQKQREAAEEAKRLEEEQKKAEEKALLEQKLEESRKNAFNNWKNN